MSAIRSRRSPTAANRREVVQARNGPKDHPALRHELAARAFVAKTLLRLGLNVEPVRPVPGRPAGWMGPDAD
jgi:hypothetical protein